MASRSLAPQLTDSQLHTSRGTPASAAPAAPPPPSGPIAPPPPSRPVAPMRLSLQLQSRFFIGSTACQPTAAVAILHRGCSCESPGLAAVDGNGPLQSRKGKALSQRGEAQDTAPETRKEVVRTHAKGSAFEGSAKGSALPVGRRAVVAIAALWLRPPLPSETLVKRL